MGRRVNTDVVNALMAFSNRIGELMQNGSPEKTAADSPRALMIGDTTRRCSIFVLHGPHQREVAEMVQQAVAAIGPASSVHAMIDDKDVPGAIKMRVSYDRLQSDRLSAALNSVTEARPSEEMFRAAAEFNHSGKPIKAGLLFVPSDEPGKIHACVLLQTSDSGLAANLRSRGVRVDNKRAKGESGLAMWADVGGATHGFGFDAYLEKSHHLSLARSGIEKLAAERSVASR